MIAKRNSAIRITRPDRFLFAARYDGNAGRSGGFHPERTVTDAATRRDGTAAAAPRIPRRKPLRRVSPEK